MEEKDFVSFETAKLMYEWGYTKYCTHFWKLKEGETTPLLIECTMFIINNVEIARNRLDCADTVFAAPTKEQASEWLNEEIIPKYNKLFQLKKAIEDESTKFN